MPFNGSGTFTRVYSWQNDATNGINITASRMDTETDGIATGLSNCITRDGQGPATANISFNGFKATGLAVATATGDALSYGRAATVTTLTTNIATAAPAVAAPIGVLGRNTLTFVDSTRAVDGRTTEIVWDSGSFSGRFVNDAYAVTTNWLAVTGTSAAVTAMTLTATAISLAGSASVTASGGTLGYATGAGGAVVQATSKATGVTLNTGAGQITMNGAALAANTTVSFTFTNSKIGLADVVAVTIASGLASSGTYLLQVDQTAVGSCRVVLKNISAGSLSEAVVFNFVVIKGATA